MTALTDAVDDAEDVGSRWETIVGQLVPRSRPRSRDMRVQNSCNGLKQILCLPSLWVNVGAVE